MDYEVEWNIMKNIYEDELPGFVAAAFAALSPHEREVLKYRNDLTLDKTAKIYGVTSERIRQIEQNAFRKIRHSIALYDEIARVGELSCDNIDSLRFSVRTSNCLKRGKISSVTELANLSYEQLIKIRGVGPKVIAEINEKLEMRGFKPIVNEEEN